MLKMKKYTPPMKFKNKLSITAHILFAIVMISCTKSTNTNFQYSVDRFADIEILRFQVKDFENLSLKQKLYIYYLSQAALEGRDILYDQNHSNNLTIRRMLESVYVHYNGNRSTSEFAQFETYLKRVWMANGIHHHYSGDKFQPDFNPEYLSVLLRSIDLQLLPLRENETLEQFTNRIFPVIFDPTLYAKRSNQNPGDDLVLSSANNFYEGVYQAEVEKFYAAKKDVNDTTPVPYGLNSKLIKKNGQVLEKTYKSGGMYGEAIDRIIGWLDKAKEVAENPHQQKIIETLILYYQTGDLQHYDTYSILWVQDTHSRIDFVNGFTETYTDPLGLKATWEALVNFKDVEATKRTEIISENAQWFEDHSPIDNAFKKKNVTGISAKVVTAAMLGGDCYPATPIGINLPNSNWIRAAHGSKSVTIENITDAYDQASQGSGFNEEFMWSDTEIQRAKKYGALTNNLHTDLHECLGHGSGQLLPGVSPDALKAYASPIEESRADLFSLYYMADPIMVQLNLLPNNEAYKAAYYQYMMNGLMTQLIRIEPGKNIEQAHMRNRQLIARWVYEKGKQDKVTELIVKNNKTYVVIHDFEKLRQLFGNLLGIVQRIKSTGDWLAAQQLIETYAVKVDQNIHSEILERYATLNIAPYKGFVNPEYTVVRNASGEIMDVAIVYTENFVEQHLRYSKYYSSLPHDN